MTEVIFLVSDEEPQRFFTNFDDAVKEQLDVIYSFDKYGERVACYSRMSDGKYYKEVSLILRGSKDY